MKMKTNGTVLALALGIVCVQSASAQSFKKVKVSGSVPIVQVASGGISVWALASNGNPYILTGKTFVLANTISLTQIAVGGGNAAQADTVWGLNSSSGNVYRASKSGSSWTFSQVPGALDLIEVGPGYQDSCHPYEVWGLNPGGQIFRYNFCGNSFDTVPGILCEIQVGGGDIWGAQCDANTYEFDFSIGIFVQIAQFTAIPSLTVGPGGNAVWLVDTGNSFVWYYDETLHAFQAPNKPDSGFTQIQAGGDGVWALSQANIIYRLEPSKFRLVEVPGPALTSISVGSGGGVWGIDSSHQVYAFSTP